MASKPQSILVGSAKYDVHWSEESWTYQMKSRNLRTTELLGTTDVVKEAMWINPEASDNQKADTLLHEVLHAIVGTAGIELAGSGDTEERAVSVISPWLLLVLKTNPELIAYLLDPDGADAVEPPF